jgi:hypothetical protein
MAMFDISKYVLIGLENEGRLSPMAFNEGGRKIYYDIREVNKLFQHVEPVRKSIIKK